MPMLVHSQLTGDLLLATVTVAADRTRALTGLDQYVYQFDCGCILGSLVSTPRRRSFPLSSRSARLSFRSLPVSDSTKGR